MTKIEITASLQSLTAYIEKEQYSGFDPYDALNSPFFKLPFLKKNKIVRFGIQQLVKRSPINLRPLLFIKKGMNPVTLGLCLQGYTALATSQSNLSPELKSKCDFLIHKLQELVTPNFKGACWGYDFPWESRNVNIPAYQPTVVATGIITNALFKHYQLTGNETALLLCRSACEFVLKDLNQHEEPDGSICFSYSPFDTTNVFNASIKGARLLIQVYHVTKEQHLLTTAEKAIRFVINNQRADGSWYYSKAQKGNWIDNYHSGYILDCLDEYMLLSGDKKWKAEIEKGFQYYIRNLFIDGYIPKFFSHSIYPLDCTSAAQAILTLTRYNLPENASAAAGHTIREMQSEKGFFYFRKYRFFTERHSFMRWSNAWMFAALCTLSAKLDSVK